MMDRVVQAPFAMRSFFWKTVVLATLPALALAWGGGEERRPARGPVVGTTRTTSAALRTNASMTPPVRLPVFVETSSAVKRVTTTRCDREAACNNVGTGKPYGDRDACVNEIGHYVVAALPAEACPAGADADALSICVRDVEAEPCAEGGVAAVDRLSSCSRERLCATPF
jgi:hypothetical protein